MNLHAVKPGGQLFSAPIHPASTDATTTPNPRLHHPTTTNHHLRLPDTMPDLVNSTSRLLRDGVKNHVDDIPVQWSLQNYSPARPST
jgi:hypothetical protein